MVTSSHVDGPVPKRSVRQLILRAVTMATAGLAVLAPASACTAIAAGQPSAASAAAPAPAGAPPGGDTKPIQTPQSRASELISPATVFIQVDWSATIVLDAGREVREQWSGGCTGFVVNPDGYIVTAGHCVDDGREGAQHDAVELAVADAVRDHRMTAADGSGLLGAVDSGQLPLTVKGKVADSRPDREVHVTIGGGKAQWNGTGSTRFNARVLDFRPASAGDVALLKIEASDLPVAALASKDNIEVGQPVLAVGYPLELANDTKTTEIALTNRSGVINSLDTQGEHGSGSLFYETSTPLTKGMSGGAVVNLDGGVVGLASNVSTTSTSQNYFIVPSSVISEMLAGKVANTPGRIDPVYRKGLDDYYAGYYTDAIADFDQALALMPSMQLAIDKRSDAAQRRQQFGDQSKPLSPAATGQPTLMSLLVIGGAAVGALIVLVGCGLMWRRRRRRIQGGRLGPDSSSMSIDSARQATEFFPPMNNAGGVGALRDPSEQNEGTPNEFHRGFGETSEMGSPRTTVATQSTARVCPGCGGQHLPGDVFCSRCGTRLDRSI